MKRSNGTGTVVKLSGTRRKPYAVKVSGRDSRGYVVQKYLSYHRTSAEAQAALEAYNSQTARPVIDGYSTTLKAVYDVWSLRKYPRSGRSSVASSKAAWKYLEPLYDRKVTSIGIDDWQDIVDKAAMAGKSKSTVNNIIILIHALCDFAMERDLIVKDYSRFIDTPSIGVKVKKGAFTPQQMAKLENLAAEGFPWADTVLMLCYTGFRINEFLSLTRFSYNAEGNYLMGGSKTAAGKNRIVPVHHKIKPYLDKWLATDGPRLILRDGKAVSDHDYRLRCFAPVMAQLGQANATPHWCRHTFATLLNKAGVPELERKRLLGHSDKNITDHYTHTDIETLRKWLETVA